MDSGRPIHTVSSLNVGGAERLVIDLAAVQRRHGLRPVILSLGAPSDVLYGEARANDIEVLLLNYARSELQQFRELFGMTRSRQPTALHIHSPWCLRKLAPILPFMRGNVVYTRHGAHPYKSAYWRLLHKWVHRYVDHLTFVSQEACEIHRRTYHASDVPHHVLEFGVPLPSGATASRAIDTRLARVGSVGRLVEIKGQRHIIDALAALPAGATPELHFYGDGPERESLRAQAGARIPGKAFFHGEVIDRQQIYAAMDVLVVASSMEGLSLAVMEAMARGIVVIATDVGGNSRLINNGETGLLVPYGDPGAIAQAVQKLGHDPQLRARLADAARARIQSHFSLETSAARLVPLYGF